MEQEFQKVTNAGLSRYRVALTARANVLIINNLKFLEADSVQATIQNDQHPPVRCFFLFPCGCRNPYRKKNLLFQAS